MGHRDELLRLFRIGLEDLEANRAGTLSQRQAHYFKQNGIRSVILSLGIVLFLAVILFGVASKPLVPIQWILTSILAAIVLAIGYNDYSKLRLAAADPRVECLTGPTRIRKLGRAGWYLSIANRSFKLPAHSRIMKSDAAYRVYIAPKAPRESCIVAIEPDGWE
jgi:hypothetical protein